MPRGLVTMVLALAATSCTPANRIPGPFLPKTPGYTYQEGVVSKHGQPILRVVQTNVDSLATYYEVKDRGGADLVTVSFQTSVESTLEVRADFWQLGVHYHVRSPIIPFTQLLASYIDNGVLVDGTVSKEGLERYAAERRFPIRNTAAEERRVSMASKRMSCQQCVEDYRACQVAASNRRTSGRPGVTVSTTCETQFQGCSQGGFTTRPDDWPCGPPR